MMVNKKYLISSILVVLISIAMISAVESVSAAKYKTIDTGKKAFKDNNIPMISKWNAKSNGKTVIAYWKLYFKNPKTKRYILASNVKFSFKKISKTKLVGTGTTYKTVAAPYSKEPIASKTRLSAKSYYFKELRPLLSNPSKTH